MTVPTSKVSTVSFISGQSSWISFVPELILKVLIGEKPSLTLRFKYFAEALECSLYNPF